jgi:hypothetical protein
MQASQPFQHTVTNKVNYDANVTTNYLETDAAAWRIGPFSVCCEAFAYSVRLSL